MKLTTSTNRYNKNKITKAINTTFTSLAISTLIFASPSFAQTKEDDVEVIEIKSVYKRSLVEAIDTKRNSSEVVDVISAEDVGKFPDANLAESLQRITGVQITRDRGEGKNVSIRGLPADFAKITLNGRTIASGLVKSETNTIPRSFDFTTLSSDFVSSLEVNKSSSADLVDGGLSGNVDVKTPRAFRIGEEKFSASVNLTNEDNIDDNGYQMAALYSNVFNDETVGITFGASYSGRKLETHRYTGSNDLVSESEGKDYNGDGVINTDTQVFIPGNSVYQKIPEERKRLNVLGSLEFRIGDNTDIFFEGLYTELDTQTTRLANYHRFINIAGEVDSSKTSSRTLSVLDGDGNYRDIEFAEILGATAVDQRNGSRSADQVSDSVTLAAGINHELDNLSFSGELSYSKSQQTRSYLNIAQAAFGGVGGNGGMQIDFSDGGDLPLVNYYNGYDEARLDPNNFRIFSLNGEFNRQSEDEIMEAKVDFEYLLDTEYFSSVEFGAHYSDRSFYLDNGRLVIGGDALNTLLGGELQESIAIPGSLNIAPYTQFVELDNGYSSFNGDIPSTYISSDTRKLLNMFSDAEFAAAGIVTNTADNTFDISEQTIAAYSKVNFELSDYNMKGNFGVRIIQTKMQTKGVASDLSGIVIEPEAGDFTTVPPGEDVNVDRSYTDFLPSFNLSWNYDDDTVIRVAASRTMSRPTLDLLTPTTSVDGSISTINSRNPNLDPFRANNIDFAYEWYFNNAGLLSATLFYKSLDSLVTNVSYVQDITINSQAADGVKTPVTRPFTFNSYENTSGVTLQGIELSYQQQFDFLPGFLEHTGVQANYTYVDNSEPQLLSGASKNNYNLTAYYEDEMLSARVIYSYRDGFISSGLTPNQLGAKQLEYGTLDASVTLTVTENVSLTFQASNLTDEAVVEITQIGDIPLEYQDNGRRFVFGARMSF